MTEPFGVTYLTFEEMYEQNKWCGSWNSYIRSNYRPLMASDGMYFLPKDCRLSSSFLSYKPKKYKIAYNEVLSHDAVGQDIHGGDIVYYSSMYGRSIHHGFYFVRNITDGRGQLVCHFWRRSSKKFDITTNNINNISECIVIDKSHFLRKFELEGIFVPEEY